MVHKLTKRAKTVYNRQAVKATWQVQPTKKVFTIAMDQESWR